MQVDGQSGLRVPLMLKGVGYSLFIAEFSDDKNRDLKLLSFNLELVKGRRGDEDFFQNLIASLQGSMDIGHLATNEAGDSADFNISHLYHGEIPDCIFTAIYDEIVRVLTEVAPTFNANDDSSGGVQ